MNMTQKQHSQTSQSLFRMDLKNTRILIIDKAKHQSDLNQTLHQKTNTPAGRDSLRCCSIQRYDRTARGQIIKTVKQ
jgi:hypothetical protein